LLFGWYNKTNNLSSTHSIVITMLSTKVNRRTRVAAAVGGLAAVAAPAAQNMFNEAVKSFAQAKARSQRRAARKEGKPPSKGAIKAIDAPVSFGTTSNTLVRQTVLRSSGNAATVRGTTILGNVVTSSTASAFPQVGCYASSNPLTFIDRLQVMASTYDKYVYTKLKLKYVPMVGTSTAGLVAIAIDRDYMDPPQTLSWAQTLSYESVAMGSVWASHNCTMGRDSHEKRAYFTNFQDEADLHESEQFKFYAYTLGAPVSTMIGQLVLEYEIELISPVYAPTELLPLSIIGMQQTVSASGVCAATSGNFTFSFLGPTNQFAGVYELFVTGNPSFLFFTLGSGGAVISAASQGSYILYAKASNIASSGLYSLYFDYPTALRGGPAFYNTAATASTLFSGATVTWRLLQATSPAGN